MPVEREVPREAPPDQVRCAYCHEPDPDEECELCPRCSATLHVDCWAESRRCPTLGCEFVPDDEAARAQPTNTYPLDRIVAVVVFVGLLLVFMHLAPAFSFPEIHLRLR